MQDRNAEMVENLVQDFPTRNEYAQSGARLSDVMMWLNRDGGGSLMWAFDAQSIACYGRGVASVWAENNITLANYAAVTGRGGPYVTLDGINEYLSIGDQLFQEAGAYSLLVWAWFYPSAVATTQTIAAKWTAAGNLRSWWMRLSPVTVAIKFSTDQDGLAGATAEMDSSLTVTAGYWHFAAGYFVPSTSMYTFVGRADDASLTIDTYTMSIPASLFDGAAPLTLGANAVANFLGGRLGTGLARANVPEANVRSHVTRLFQATRWFYGG